MPFEPNGDFRPYFCRTLQRHIWVLGYFGGGEVNFNRFKEAATYFAELTGIPMESVNIHEIRISRRHKYFKYLYSLEPDQQPIEQSIVMGDVFAWLND